MLWAGEEQSEKGREGRKEAGRKRHREGWRQAEMEACRKRGIEVEEARELPCPVFQGDLYFEVAAAVQWRS